jgi:hypothetical protein
MSRPPWLGMVIPRRPDESTVRGFQSGADIQIRDARQPGGIPQLGR